MVQEESNLPQESGESHMDIIVEPWKKLVIHELLEYKFEDLAKLVATQSVQQGGTAIPTISWAEGVAFLISPFPDESEVIIEEKLKGIIHYNTVLFALKPGFEAEIFMRGSQIRINLIDVGTNEIFKLLAETLKDHAKIPATIAGNASSKVPQSVSAGLQ
ncbi:MAG TPA: hypothetical protein VN739_00590 [Nitrososphaerales archaeon]|nr:hypothetical protein [Nitrososphaerales archaeon]